MRIFIIISDMSTSEYSPYQMRIGMDIAANPMLYARRLCLKVWLGVLDTNHTLSAMINPVQA